MSMSILEIAALVLCAYYLFYCLIQKKAIYLRAGKGLGILLQAVSDIDTELFFESLALLGFMSMLEEPQDEGRRGRTVGKGIIYWVLEMRLAADK